MRRLAAVALALAAAAGAVTAACGTADDPASEAPAADPASFALALGVDLEDDASLDRLGRYDLVVIDGEEATTEQVTALHGHGATVLAYLSAGTLEPGRPWFPEAQEQGWLLDRWDEWDEWYADVDDVRLRDLLVNVASDHLEKGFDGLFLDNTDMVQTHPDQEQGMRELVAALDDLTGDRRLLFAQNGDPAEAGIVGHLDGWNREDVSFTYDVDRRSYRQVSRADHEAAVAQLERFGELGLITTATDYLARSTGEQADQAAEAACAAGARPYVSDIGLTRIPDPPRTCRDG